MSYSQKVIEHYENPRNVGSLDKNDPNTGTGLVGAPACGDVMKLQIKVNAQGIIEDAKFKTFGCGSAIAASSVATEWIKGKTLEEANKIQNSEIVKELSLPPVKIHCSILAEDAIRAAIADFRKKQAAMKIIPISRCNFCGSKIRNGEPDCLCTPPFSTKESNVIVLDETDWNVFQEVINSPPRDIPALRQLLTCEFGEED